MTTFLSPLPGSALHAAVLASLSDSVEGSQQSEGAGLTAYTTEHPKHPTAGWENWPRLVTEWPNVPNGSRGLKSCWSKDLTKNLERISVSFRNMTTVSELSEFRREMKR